MYGRAYFVVTRGLRHADLPVLNAAPTFFQMTLGVYADASVMTAARIFDRHPRTISIHRLLSLALREPKIFQYGTANEVRKVVSEAKLSLAKLEKILRTVQARRNKAMAHSDPRAIVDPDGYSHEGFVS